MVRKASSWRSVYEEIIGDFRDRPGRRVIWRPAKKIFHSNLHAGCYRVLSHTMVPQQNHNGVAAKQICFHPPIQAQYNVDDKRTLKTNDIRSEFIKDRVPSFERVPSIHV